MMKSNKKSLNTDDNVQAHDSARHQLQKALAKEIKKLKINMMLKLGKRISTLSDELAGYATDSEASDTNATADASNCSSGDEDNVRLKRIKIAAKLQNEEHLRNALRLLDHMKIAGVIIERHCSPLQQQQQQQAEGLSKEEEELYDQFITNVKVKEVLSGYPNLVTKSLEKIETVHRVEQRKKLLRQRKQQQKHHDTQMRAIKPLHASKSSRVALIRTNKSVFVESLSKASDSIELGTNSSSSNSSSGRHNEVKLMKSLRNQQNRIANRLKRKQEQQQSDPSSPTENDNAARKSKKRRDHHESAPRKQSSNSADAVVKNSDNTVLSKAAVAGKGWQTSSGIHPSWAAKQKAKLCIPSAVTATQSQGKKIIFDD